MENHLAPAERDALNLETVAEAQLARELAWEHAELLARAGCSRRVLHAALVRLAVFTVRLADLLEQEEHGE